MFTLTQTRMRSDCTASYNIDLDKSYTVGEFINAVLVNKKAEWGHIVILKDITMDITAPRKSICEYEYGKVINQTEMTDEMLNCKIVTALASGGYSNMDYYLYLETKTDISKTILPKGFVFDENGKPVSNNKA